ncbi:hypothetical protein [Occallatibacter riparius]|uniref:Outer membrane protein beta-barrel domain-containing protein n=1 Tax=Occallatibacter riparius TaxID=1002689 RepID=A0A9J7BN05_9BACT|nr:hypothetical protein [Occallatibacter riparius]UWZ84104.1 hypothetical protein MOP44_26555 [Occallatibacter riparius]
MRKWLFSILAVPAVLMPLAVAAQVAPDRPARPTSDEPKNVVYAGMSYTSINQVNQSRYGLVGANIEYTRNFGRWFGAVADGAYYFGSFQSGNPGDPTVYHIMGGAELHAPIFENWNLFARALLGVAHTGGENMSPDLSFAGGPGVGLEHIFKNKHWGVRASGDYIGASFSLRNNTPQQSNSPHRTFNGRGGIGVEYRF